ncbi:MAG: MauE/DoxX family redox-associated membrane protein [Candidatus Paceibacterota bacterium]
MNTAHAHPVRAHHTIKDFLPLITILAVICAFTAYMVLSTSQPDLMYGMRMFMAGFFVVFGGFKMLRWRGFVEAYREYDLLAQRSMVYAYLYPLIEVGLGLAYFFAWQLVSVSSVTIVVMMIGAYGVWLKLRKREEIPCACHGVVFKIPMTKVTLFEDLLMAAMAVGMLIYLMM